MSNLAYIPNDYARGYVASRSNSRKGVYVPMSYVDICNDNMHDAILFSQIMYWHEPSKETGGTRMRRVKDGFLWVAKNHSDWYAECRIKTSTARNCLDRLKSIGLIFYELHGEKGLKTPFIRVNWDKFSELMQTWETNNMPESVAITPDITGHTPAISGQGGVPSADIPLPLEVKPNTESTSKNTNIDDARQSKFSISDLNGVELLLDEIDLFKDKYKDRLLFLSDFEDYSVDDWLVGIEKFKTEIARKIQEQGDKYTPLPYEYLRKMVSGQGVIRKQSAIIEASKPVTPYHQAVVIDESPRMDKVAALEFLATFKKENQLVEDQNQ